VNAVVQFFFVAKGVRANWDRLGDISGAVIHLQHVKKQMSLALGGIYDGKTHTTPDTSRLVWRVANKVHELGLDNYDPGRSGNDRQKAIVNLIESGEQKLVSSSLATFNKKLACMMEGNLDGAAAMTEHDELPAVAMSVDMDDV
jgi:hypothetical protein